MAESANYHELALLYGPEQAAAVEGRIERTIAAFLNEHGTANKIRDPLRFSARDAILITYGDMVQRPEESPLHTLAKFAGEHLRGTVSTVHLLPFYPFSSDDGFSVIDYRKVDPVLGSWDDVAEINSDFQLMFDAVINHISAQSRWFQGYLQDEDAYRNYFITVDPAQDLSAVFRPRALPLLTEVSTVAGPRHVWTTFSADQIDLNFANPDVLLAIVELLLFYISKGADFIRLDAIAYMWKEPGTNCIHLPQTHAIIQLWRKILDRAAPWVALITETNVPHEENISYFGDGANEAQMVYNFSLPPLTLHAFHTGNAEILSTWAQTLTLPSDRVTFFNFLASHDGIGLTPARGLLSETEIAAMAARVQAVGGRVSFRSNPDGSRSAYELNVNYLDALGHPAHPDEGTQRIAERFLASQAIMLALRGVPGIYFHSLFGSRGWPEGVAQSGRARTINRQKLSVDILDEELATAGSLRQLVFSGYRRMLRARAASTAFHPNGGQTILKLHPAVFAVRRTSLDQRESVTCLQNVSAQAATVALSMDRLTDLLTGRMISAPTRLQLRPYQVLWLCEDV